MQTFLKTRVSFMHDSVKLETFFLKKMNQNEVHNTFEYGCNK